MMQRILSVILVFLSTIPYQTLAITSHYALQPAQSILDEGILLFEQHQYGAAQKCLEGYLSSPWKKYKQEHAAYYVILSALENKDPHIEMLVQHFMIHYPNSPHIETIRYRLAKFLSEQGAFHKSLSLYQKIRTEYLNSNYKDEFPYEQANTYLQLKDWLKAKEGFASITNTNSPYYYPAQLRMAYIAFEQGDYHEALAALQKVSKNKNYLPEARSLTLKVHHRAGAFDALLAYVKHCPALSLNKQEQLLIGDAYFFLKQYTEAATHYQAYLDKETATDRITLSKLGHALYETQQYPQALACFKQLLHQDDQASQAAAYYSGLIYEKKGAIPEAIDVFSLAASQKFDLEVSDLASIKLAALYYQQGSFTEAIQSIHTFIQENQDSKSLSMAQALLVQCYYKTKAYQTAIDYIAALPYKNEMLLKLYQKVLFYQGLEAYNKGKQEDAIKCLRQSLLFLFKPSLALQAQFWLGEAYSALGAYQKALECYTTVMEKGSCNTLYHEKALYGLAYAYFNTGDYTNAAKNFEQYVNITEKQPSTAHYDAILRLGDCYYVKKNYEQALNRYESVYTYHPAHVRYQEALIYQLLGNSLLATQCLQEVITTHVQTKYYEKALFQEACMLFTTGNYQAAIQKFTYLIEKCSTSDLQPEWLMKRALAYENLHKMEEAAADYIAILEHYPSHENVESACMALSNIFSAQGTPEKMDKYLQKHTQVAQQLANHSDTHTLERAKKLFYSEQYAKVLQQLTSFDKRYPKSTYLPEVYLLMAESYYRLHNTNQAINFYKKVEASGQTGLHKKVWLRIADLAYQNNKFQEALIYYQKLHKMQMQLSNKEYYRTSIGLIKASFAIKQYQTTIPVCLQLVHNPKEIPAEIIQQARLYLGKVAMQRSEYKNAKGHFLKASTPPYTAIAAEAQYLLAHAEFKLKAYKASLNVLFELIEKFPHNKNYIDPAFLLMADNYIILGNFTQAQATLDSIISQSKNKKNIELAKKKRAEVMSKLKKVKNLPVK